MVRIPFCCALRIAIIVGVVAAVPYSGGAQTAPTLIVDAGGNPHPINPDIYGIASYGLDATFAKEIQIPNIRWGGDATTRYNWEVDSSNSGFDWYFMGGNGQATPVPSASADLMINTYKTASDAHTLLTIPIIPYVNKSSAWSCSFPVSTYGVQESTNPYVFPNGETCGNSLSSPSGTQLIDNDIYANHVDNSTALQQGWLQHLVTTFGTAANGGVPYYQLDNEPGGWSNTHRDVEPTQPDYSTIISLGQQYAAMIKQNDPSAKVFGPVDFTLGGWIGTPSQQDNLFAGQYYLQQMAAYDQTNKQRILDYFDEHYYGGGSTDAAELASTRALWDPTFNSGSWVEQWYFDGPMMLIPRFQSWIQTYYPGTKLSISEYSFSSGTNPLVDALTEADVLGIYGRQSLDFANMWNAPQPTAPVAYSFRLYRNYDGAGGQFGDTAVNSTSTNQDQLSVYAAVRSSDGALTVVAINKTTSTIQTSLTVANFNSSATAAVYTYSNANLTQIVAGTRVPVVSNAVNYNFPAYSATVFVFTPAPVAPATTTTSLAASSTKITSGQSITFTANVAPQFGSGSPTGLVTFLDGPAQIGSSPIGAGSASLSAANLSFGTHEVTASYSGDSTYAASASAALTVNVDTAPAVDYSLSLSSSSLTVAPGGSGTLTITVSPINGFNQLLSLACTGLPASATCSFSPQNVNPSGGTSATTLTVHVSPATTAQGLSTRPFSGPRLIAFYMFAIALGGIAGAAGEKRSLTLAARLTVSFTASAIVFASLVITAGCGSNLSQVADQPSVSPSTPSIVTVTASASNTPTHTQQFTLNVTP
ncbi:MAG: glycoside hydrolase family 44 protein [Candidatus Sulfotelmatobacter sp.]